MKKKVLIWEIKCNFCGKKFKSLNKESLEKTYKKHISDCEKAKTFRSEIKDLEEEGIFRSFLEVVKSQELEKSLKKIIKKYNSSPGELIEVLELMRDYGEG